MPLKDELIRQLETHRDTPLSGQALARQFSVSRTAVWKAINELKAEGYHIESATNRGYRLASDDDRLSASAIADLLAGNLPVYAFDAVDSTLNEAKRKQADGTDSRFLIVADSPNQLGAGAGAGSFFRRRVPDCI